MVDAYRHALSTTFLAGAIIAAIACPRLRRFFAIHIFLVYFWGSGMTCHALARSLWSPSDSVAAAPTSRRNPRQRSTPQNLTISRRHLCNFIDHLQDELRHPPDPLSKGFLNERHDSLRFARNTWRLVEPQTADRFMCPAGGISGLRIKSYVTVAVQGRGIDAIRFAGRCKKAPKPVLCRLHATRSAGIKYREHSCTACDIPVRRATMTCALRRRRLVRLELTQTFYQRRAGEGMLVASPGVNQPRKGGERGNGPAWSVAKAATTVVSHQVV